MVIRSSTALYYLRKTLGCFKNAFSVYRKKNINKSDRYQIWRTHRLSSWEKSKQDQREKVYLLSHGGGCWEMSAAAGATAAVGAAKRTRKKTLAAIMGSLVVVFYTWAMFVMGFAWNMGLGIFFLSVLIIQIQPMKEDFFIFYFLLLSLLFHNF